MGLKDLKETEETTRNVRAESITRSQLILHLGQFGSSVLALRSHAGDVQSMYTLQNSNIGEGTYGSVPRPGITLLPSGLVMTLDH